MKQRSEYFGEMVTKMTRLEKIKNMSQLEMVKFLDKLTERCFSHDCECCPICEGSGVACQPADIKKWLESEVKTR